MISDMYIYEIAVLAAVSAVLMVLTDCLTPVKTKMAVIACILAEILAVTLV